MRPLADDVPADSALWSVRMADATLARYPVSRMRWHYEDGFLMHAVAQVAQRTGQPCYGQAVREYVDRFVQGDGSIATYWLADYNLDQIAPGRLLFPLHEAGGDARFGQAIALLREQLARQPRTRAGGFWHKLIYPYQMWLDGIYMAGPFYAQYAAAFGTLRPSMAQSADRDAGAACAIRTGLLYTRGMSCQQRWAAPGTGCSPHFTGSRHRLVRNGHRGRAGRAAHTDHPQQPALIGILRRSLDAVRHDARSGLSWRRVLDQGGRPATT